MDKSDYIEALYKLGYRRNLDDWCKLLGVSKQTHYKYRSGHRPVPIPTRRLIEVLEENRTLKEKIAIMEAMIRRLRKL